MPMIQVVDDVLVITAGEDCGETTPVATPVSSPISAPTAAAPTKPVAGSSAWASVTNARRTLAAVVAFGVVGWPAAAAVVLGTLGQAQAQTAVECQLTPITVQVYVGTASDEIVMRESKSGDFEVCPPEALWWKHHPDVYGGYEGCVGEEGYYPCGDSSGLSDADYNFSHTVKWDGTACVNTGVTTENRTYWILWGDPLGTKLHSMLSPFTRSPFLTTCAIFSFHK
jgi:hypothetical protein